MAFQDRERDLGDEPRWWPELAWLDWLSLGLISVLLLLLCVVRSRSRLFWSDEALGFTVLRDPRLTRVLHGWWEGADGGGLFYYLTGHVWFALFGASPLTLRLFSTCCFLVAITIVWCMARRIYTLPVVAVSVALTFFLPTYVIWQEINGRFYGFFLATAALAVACTMAAAERREHLPVRFLLLTSGAHALLIGSHVLGLVYSAGLLSALVISDVFERRRRVSLYGSVLFAWMVMLPLSFHAIRATTMVAQGVFWPVKPHFRDLILGFFAYSHKLALFAVLLLLVAVAQSLVNPAKASVLRPVSRERRSLLVVLGGLVLSQLVIFAKSRVGLSIYSDRYLLPLVVAVVLVLAEGLTRALGASLVRRLSRPLPAMVIAVFAVATLFVEGTRSHVYDQLYAGLDYPRHMEAVLPAGHDVVVTLMPTYLLLRLFDTDHHYVFATDWGYDGATAGADLSGQRMMENVARGGLAPHEVLDLPEIVREFPEFTIVAEPARLPWLKDRFERNGLFEVSEAGALRDWYPMTIWRVRCRHPEAGCGLGAVLSK